MVKNNEAIQVGMNLAMQASHYDAGEDFCNALKYYEASIEKLIPLAESEEMPLCIIMHGVHTYR